MMPNLARVQQEILNGRLWKARDRLLGLFASYPTSPEVLGLLGDVFFKMGDLPEAGRYWYLTERNDESSQESFKAFRERCGNDPCILLKQLPIRVHPNKYGPIAFKRLQDLVDRCLENKPRNLRAFLPVENSEEMWEQSKWAIWRDKTVMVLSLIFLIGPWLAGFFTLAIWVTSLIVALL